MAKLKKTNNIQYCQGCETVATLLYEDSINGVSILGRIWLYMMQFKMHILHDLEIPLQGVFIRDILINILKKAHGKMNVLCLYY